MTALFSFIATPFGYVMRFIYELVGSYGLSIILFALLAKLITLPFTVKSKRGMLDQQRLQPKLQELQKKYGKDRQKYSEEMQKLYDQEGVSPMAGCLPSLISLPIMLGLYYVISQPLTYFMQLSPDEIAAVAKTLGHTMGTGYTAQIELAGLMHQNFGALAGISDKLMAVDFNFLGMNLAATPSFKVFNLLWIIPVLSGATSFLYSKITMAMTAKAAGTQGAQNTQTQQMNGMMNLMMPAMSVYFGFILPAGLGVYWIANNLLMLAQDYLVTKFLMKQREKKNELQG